MYQIDTVKMHSDLQKKMNFILSVALPMTSIAYYDYYNCNHHDNIAIVMDCTILFAYKIRSTLKNIRVHVNH